MTSPVTPETEMVQGPNDPYQMTKTVMMEGLSDSEQIIGEMPRRRRRKSNNPEIQT